jgi:hypothetical protein
MVAGGDNEGPLDMIMIVVVLITGDVDSLGVDEYDNR